MRVSPSLPPQHPSNLCALCGILAPFAVKILTSVAATVRQAQPLSYNASGNRMNLPAYPALLSLSSGKAEAVTAASLLCQVLLGIAFLGTFSSTIFLFMVLVAAARWRRGARAEQRAAAATAESSLPSVTIFKPVHGMEAQLEENLESFFQQDYPAFEIILGARDANDAGLQLADKIRRRYPQVKSQLVVSGPPTWPNAKVFSLSKMIPCSSNDYFVISDSDVRVSRNFLRDVIPALLDSKIGLITCPYRGVTAGDFWSTLEALGMSVEMPSGVMVAEMLEGIRFALGPAVALRRDALEKIGGIASTADYYSDDFRPGQHGLGGGVQSDFLSSHRSACADAATIEPNSGGPVAVDEEHALLAPPGHIWERDSRMPCPLEYWVSLQQQLLVTWD